MPEFRTADVNAVRADGLGKGVLLKGYINAQLPTSTVFADGTTNGFQASTHAWRFNNTIDDQFLNLVASLPEDFDGTSSLVIRVNGRISDDGTDNDVTMLCGVYFDGGADVGVLNAQIVTDAAAYQEFVFIIPPASVPDTASAVHVTLRYDNNLDVADGFINRVCLEFGRTIAS